MKDEIDAAVSLMAHVAAVMGALGLVAVVTWLVAEMLREDEER